MKKVVIIGAGAAGMFAAIKAAELAKKVILIEKNKILGKKILISAQVSHPLNMYLNPC